MTVVTTLPAVVLVLVLSVLGWWTDRAAWRVGNEAGTRGEGGVRR